MMKRVLALVLSCTLCFCSCSKGEQLQKQDKVCEITWVMESDEAISENNVKIFNDLLQEKGYGISLKFTYLDGDLLGENPTMYQDALEELILEQQADIAFLGWEYDRTPGLCAEFVRKGYCYPLDDWLQTEEGKEIYELYDEEVWDVCRIDGNIVAFPNERHVYYPSTVVGFNESYVTKEQAEQWDGSWDGLFQLMQEIKLPENVYMMRGYPEISRFMETESGMNYVLQDNIVYDMSVGKFTHLFDTDAFYEYLCFLNKCWNEGYLFEVNMGSFTYDDEVYESMLAGNYAVDINADCNDSEDHVIYVEAPSYTIENDLGAQTIVLNNSSHIEESLCLLSALRTDNDLANALLYGQEGQDYTLNSEGKIEGDVSPEGEWSLGLADGILQTTESSYDDFRAYKKQMLTSDKRLSSGIVGFYPDYSEIREEMSSYLQTIEEYENCWQKKKFQQKYQEGKEKLDRQTKSLLAELQNQLEEWRKTGE